MSDLYDRIKADLPNFPEDILEQWIGYYAKYDGWPPSENPDDTPKDRWTHLLLNRPLSYWLGITWSEESINLNHINWDPLYEKTIREIIFAHVFGEDNDYSKFMGYDGKTRFESILLYIRKTGYLPRKPILIYDNRCYEVCDGNHRIAASIFCSNQRYSQIREVYFRKFETEPATLAENTLVWIGHSNDERHN